MSGLYSFRFYVDSLDQKSYIILSTTIKVVRVVFHCRVSLG